VVKEINRYSAFVSYRHMARDWRRGFGIMALEAYRTPKAWNGVHWTRENAPALH
jgi:hypothetical protein